MPFFRKFDMELKGWTLEGLAKELGMSKNSTQKRIERANIEPFFKGSVYPPETLDKIREAKRGRPKKPKTPDPAEAPAKKARKHS